MKLDLIDKKPLREDNWFAAYSVTLRTPVLIYFNPGKSDRWEGDIGRFYLIYQITDDEFEKYDTDEFDDVITFVEENKQNRYLGRSERFDDIILRSGADIGIKSSYYEKNTIKNNDDSEKSGLKVDCDQCFSVYYSKLYGCCVLDLTVGGSFMTSEYYRISRKEYRQFGTEEFYKLVDDIRRGKHKNRHLYSEPNPTISRSYYNQRKYELSDITKATIIACVVVALLYLLYIFVLSLYFKI